MKLKTIGTVLVVAVATCLAFAPYVFRWTGMWGLLGVAGAGLAVIPFARKI